MNRLIIVGGLYPGVGSTFTAISLARVLHSLAVPHALVEHPVNEPDLYMLLYGDQKAPRSYVFASDAIHTEGAALSDIQWESGFSTWVPVHPDGIKAGWNESDTFKLQYAVKKPVVIWDISSNWLEPSVQELCLSADAVIAVLDASPGKLYRPSTRKMIHQLQSIQAAGKSVHYIANREVPPEIRKEWEDSLPGTIDCTIPELPRGEVMRSLWKGELAQDDPPSLEKLQPALRPMLQSFLPEEIIRGHGFRRKSFFSLFGK